METHKGNKLFYGAIDVIFNDPYLIGQKDLAYISLLCLGDYCDPPQPQTL